MSVRLTTGRVHDSRPKVFFELAKNLVGWVFGNKGYLLNSARKAFVQEDGQLYWAVKPVKG